MKTLMITFSILMMAVACNKDPQANLQQEKEEARQDYRQDVNEATQDRNEEINDAREEYNDEMKERMEDKRDEMEDSSDDMYMNEGRSDLNNDTDVRDAE